MSEISGFDYQSSWAGNCAQRALIHSLLLLGIPILESDAHHKTGVSKYKALLQGTSLSSLKKAILRCGCIPYLYESRNASDIRKHIDEFLKRGLPIIVNAEEGTHWGVLASKRSYDYYYWIDSDDTRLYGCYHWVKIRDWIENAGGYLVVGIRPKDDKKFDHSIVKNFGTVYSYFDDDDLAEYWGYYLDDLVNLFDSPSDRKLGLSAEVFFDKYGERIVENLYWQHGNVEKRRIGYELLNYLKVASAHNLSVSIAEEDNALIGITAAMAYAIL